MSRLSPVLLSALLPPLVGCSAGGGRDDTPIVTSIAVPSCAPSAELDELEVMAQGTVVDFATGAPQAGVTVDIARAWEPQAAFPADSCSVGRLTTGPDGKFGPALVKVGPRATGFQSKFVVFLAQGADISPTASDIRVSEGSAIDHEITAPSLGLADYWRGELSEGGMTSARTRGLVAFEYREASGSPAAGVAAHHALLLDNDALARGDEVRYLEADRETVAARSQSTTLGSGVALIGVTSGNLGTTDVGGRRGAESWGSTGCLIGRGWTFIEATRPLVQ